jgi:hypothetical protein
MVTKMNAKSGTAKEGVNLGVYIGWQCPSLESIWSDYAEKLIMGWEESPDGIRKDWDSDRIKVETGKILYKKGPASAVKAHRKM